MAKYETLNEDVKLDIDSDNIQIVLRNISSENISYNINKNKIITTGELRADVFVLT